MLFLKAEIVKDRNYISVDFESATEENVVTLSVKNWQVNNL